MDYDDTLHVLHGLLGKSVVLMVEGPSDDDEHVIRLEGMLQLRRDPPGFRRDVGLPPQELEARTHGEYFALAGAGVEGAEPYCEWLLERSAYVGAGWHMEDGVPHLRIEHAGVSTSILAPHWLDEGLPS